MYLLNVLTIRAYCDFLKLVIIPLYFSANFAFTAITMKAVAGGVVFAALALVGLWFGIRRLRRLANAVRGLRGKVVVITGASSGLGEGIPRLHLINVNVGWYICYDIFKLVLFTHSKSLKQ